MPKQQNFNNLVRYIKRKLGVPVNLLELTDQDIYDIVMEDVLPELSQYIGKPTWITLGPGDIKSGDPLTKSYYDSEIYTIPIPENMVIVDVQDVYWNQNAIGGPGILGLTQGYLTMLDPRDTVMANTFIDMVRSFDVVPTFRFIPPKEIQFDVALQGKNVILECKAEHTDLSTIPSDIYYEILRPKTLATIIENVIAMRKKFRNLNTPFGTIELNIEELQQRADEINRIIQEKLDSLPPDILIAFV